MSDRPHIRITRPCKFARYVGTWDDDCCNKQSKNYGIYDVTGSPRLSEVCEKCPDYQPETISGNSVDAKKNNSHDSMKKEVEK